MTMTNYKHTEEYRERFALNEGERYWITNAIGHYLKAIDEIDDTNSLISNAYVHQLFKDINSKLDCWTD